MSFLATLLLFAPLTTPLPDHPVDPGEQLSLEELLEVYRGERDRVLEAYRDSVNMLVADLEAAHEKGSGRKSALAGYRKQLLDLGPAAAPLMVQFLDPGVAPAEAVEGRAFQVALVLEALPSTRAITGNLLDILDRGSIEGRRNALRVLSASDDPQRVGPVLRELYAKSSDKYRGELLGAIARLGGKDNEAFVATILADEDARVVTLALKVLAEAKITDAAPRILELVQSTSAAARQVPRLLDYYRACHEIVDDEHCTALVALARSMVSDPGTVELLLEFLTEFQDRWNSKVKKEFKQLSSSTDQRIAEAALIGLAKGGDRGARKKLLAPYDDRIQNNVRLAQAWESRADLRYRIGDYKNAIKDYQEALKAGEAYGRTQPDVYVGLARCCARLGKLKDAHEWLDDAPLSIVMLRDLAKEPVFAEMVAHPKYGKVFHLQDQ